MSDPTEPPAWALEAAKQKFAKVFTPTWEAISTFERGEISKGKLLEIIQSEAADLLETELSAVTAKLDALLEEYDDRKAQWGDEYLWSKHENNEIIEAAREAIKNAKL